MTRSNSASSRTTAASPPLSTTPCTSSAPKPSIRTSTRTIARSPPSGFAPAPKPIGWCLATRRFSTARFHDCWEGKRSVSPGFAGKTSSPWPTTWSTGGRRASDRRALGGMIETRVQKESYALICQDLVKTNVKIQEAKTLGVPIVKRTWLDWLIVHVGFPVSTYV